MQRELPIHVEMLPPSASAIPALRHFIAGQQEAQRPLERRARFARQKPPSLPDSDARRLEVHGGVQSVLDDERAPDDDRVELQVKIKVDYDCRAPLDCHVASKARDEAAIKGGEA